MHRADEGGELGRRGGGALREAGGGAGTPVTPEQRGPGVRTRAVLQLVGLELRLEKV